MAKIPLFAGGNYGQFFFSSFDARANELKPKRVEMATLTFSRPNRSENSAPYPSFSDKQKREKNQRCKLPMLVADAASPDQTANYLDQLVPEHGAYGPVVPML